ncbi:MAG TPA: hypothetical protein VFX47_05040 [Gammaproteobacteria bacterium]|nr:hypothetical protein [Gammaproteobacteria bacterium]
MNRQWCGTLLLTTLCACNCAVFADQTLSGLAEPALTAVDASRSWLDHGSGKLAAGADDGAQAQAAALRLALAYRLELTDTVAAHVSGDAFAGEHSMAGIDEAYLSWMPVPSSSLRYRWRLGAFLPPLSLENTAVGWTTPYTLTPSLLNDWLGEELRAEGAEFVILRPGVQAASPNSFGLRFGAFHGNDTAGTMLAWRGWAANDRVTPLNHTLPLSDSPAFWPGGPFAGAKSDTNPFLSVDSRLGFYVTADWQYLDRIKLLAAHYDNRANPVAFADGEIGWHTRFDELGLRWHPLQELELIAQYLKGDTLAGRYATTRSVYNRFSSWFVLASESRGPHRVSLRYERFRVTDEDYTPLDDNNEWGDAWTAAYLYAWHEDISFGAEYLELNSTRPIRAALALQPAISEQQLRVSVRYRF